MGQYDQIQTRLTANSMNDNRRFNLSLKRDVYDRIKKAADTMTAETGCKVSAAALITAIFDDFESNAAKSK